MKELELKRTRTLVDLASVDDPYAYYMNHLYGIMDIKGLLADHQKKEIMMQRKKNKKWFRPKKTKKGSDKPPLAE